jgi:hypothetical protein
MNILALKGVALEMGPKEQNGDFLENYHNHFEYYLPKWKCPFCISWKITVHAIGTQK